MNFNFTPDISGWLTPRQKVLIEHCAVIAIIAGGEEEIDMVDFRYYNWKTNNGFIVFYQTDPEDTYTIEKFTDCALIGELIDDRIKFSYLVYSDLCSLEDCEDCENKDECEYYKEDDDYDEEEEEEE